MRALSRLTTVVVIGTIVGGASYAMSRAVRRPTVGEHFTTYALFRDASAIAIGSPVRIAGVRVGEVDALTIEGSLARVSMRLSDGLNLTQRTWATKRSDSPFSDSYIELITAGSPAEDISWLPEDRPAPPLQSGQPIPRVTEGVTTDRVLRSIDRGIPRLERGVQRMRSFVADGTQNLTGELRDRLAVAEAWIGRAEAIQRRATIERGAMQLDDTTESMQGAIRSKLDAIDRGLDAFAGGVDRVRRQVADARGEVTSKLGEVRDNLHVIDDYADDAAEAVADLRGEAPRKRGALGQLIYEDQFADDAAELTGSAAASLGTFDSIKTWIGVRSELNLLGNGPRVYAVAQVALRPDSFYLLELERGSEGAAPRSTLTTSVGTPRYTLHAEIADQVRYTIQYGKRLGRWSFRIGMKDSSGGVGSDTVLFGDRLKLSSDLFNSFDTGQPRLKVTASLRLFRQLYVLAGADDLLTPGASLPVAPSSMDVPSALETVHYGRDIFLGASLQLNDDDLASLLRIYGAVLAAAVFGG